MANSTRKIFIMYQARQWKHVQSLVANTESATLLISMVALHNAFYAQKMVQRMPQLVGLDMLCCEKIVKGLWNKSTLTRVRGLGAILLQRIISGCEKA
jgi:hypothetical protein